MSRNLGVAAAAGAVAVAFLAAVAIGSPGDPWRTVEITESEAAEAVGAFIGSAELTDRLTVRGPTDASYLRIYRVSGDRIAATVDAHTGAVVTLLIGSAIGVDGDLVVRDADALATARGFLTERGISVDGLVESSRFIYHGESSEYVVEWTRHVDDAIAPDMRIVGVDAMTGQVFHYINMQRPFEPPGVPAIGKGDAVTMAIKLIGRDAAQVENTELRIVFTETGVQRLVWNIFLADEVDETGTGQRITRHWGVEVDATSGDAVLVASS